MYSAENTQDEKKTEAEVCVLAETTFHEPFFHFIQTKGECVSLCVSLAQDTHICQKGINVSTQRRISAFHTVSNQDASL